MKKGEEVASGSSAESEPRRLTKRDLAKRSGNLPVWMFHSWTIACRARFTKAEVLSYNRQRINYFKSDLTEECGVGPWSKWELVDRRPIGAPQADERKRVSDAGEQP